MSLFTERVWRFIRDFAKRRMYKGHLLFCGTERRPHDRNTRYWASLYESRNYCTARCREKAEVAFVRNWSEKGQP